MESLIFINKVRFLHNLYMEQAAEWKIKHLRNFIHCEVILLIFFIVV